MSEALPTPPPIYQPAVQNGPPAMGVPLASGWKTGTAAPGQPTIRDDGTQGVGRLPPGGAVVPTGGQVVVERLPAREIPDEESRSERGD